MRINIGDIFEISLSDQRKAYAQYIYRDKHHGNLIKVFNYFARKNQKPDIEHIRIAPLLFPPVFTSLKNGLKYLNWKIIGNIAVENLTFPKFLNTFYHFTGKAGIWFLYDGEKETPIGRKLPEAYKKLEFLSIYAPDLIVQRIMTGEKPMEELINTNKTEVPKV